MPCCVLETWVAPAGLRVLSSVLLGTPWAQPGDICVWGRFPALAPHGNALGSKTNIVDPASCSPPNLRPLHRLNDEK